MKIVFGIFRIFLYFIRIFLGEILFVFLSFGPNWAKGPAGPAQRRPRAVVRLVHAAAPWPSRPLAAAAAGILPEPPPLTVDRSVFC